MKPKMRQKLTEPTDVVDELEIHNDEVQLEQLEDKPGIGLEVIIGVNG